MYPYKTIHCDDFGYYETYNHDGTLENNIYITCDKKLHGELLSSDRKLFDIIDTAYREDAIDCVDAVKEVIWNCTREEQFKHIHLISECMHMVRSNYDLYF